MWKDKWRGKWRGKRVSALRIVLIYLLFGGLWIFFSDKILLRLAADLQDYQVLQTYKGWIFVACTALLLYVLSVREFHVRDKVEANLENTVQEKDALMRELHHRVKNNLQLIMSLLNLQRTNSEIDEISRKIMQQLYMRVQSIAVFHEKVYHLELYSQVPLDEYIREIVNSAYYEYGEKMRAIQIELDLKEQKFTLEKALPIGLIINELLLNCLRHAFPEPPPEDARIRISLSKDHNATKLTVEDNGRGYSSTEQMEYQNSGRGLGFPLIQSLLKQVDGKIEVQNGKGTKIILWIPIETQWADRSAAG
ncbi:MAG: sensor histidine kinase [Spirochaetota bacterium]